MIKIAGRCIIAALFSAALFSLTGCAALDASSFYKEGTKYMQGNEPLKAHECFDKAIAANPDRAEYYIDNAFACMALSDYEEAGKNLDKAFSEKNNSIVRENNKKIYRARGIIAYEQGDYDAAFEYFEKALEIEELQDLNSDIRKYLGAVDLRLSKYEEAIEVFNKVLEKKKSDASAYASRAAAYVATGDLTKAAEDYDNAIAFDPGNFSYYIGKYNMYKLTGNEAEAEKVLTATYTLKTKTKEDYYNLAVVHYLCGDLKTAETELIASAGDGFYESYYYLGNICVNRGDYDAAMRYYSLYAENEGEITNVTYFDGMSECAFAGKDYEQTLSLVEKGLALGSAEGYGNLMYKKIASLEKLGRYEEAYKAAKEYNASFPDDKRIKKELTLLTEITEGF